MKEVEIAKMKDGKPVILRADPRKEISRENKSEYRIDKRIQELKKRGYNESNIRYMVGWKDFPISRIEKGMRARGVKLDGSL